MEINMTELYKKTLHYIFIKFYCFSYSLLSKLLFFSPFTDSKTNVSYNESVNSALNEYGNSILRLAYSYLHNIADAEDILQDTLLQYIETKPDFKDYRHKKAWFLKVASNLSKNKIKYNKKREYTLLEENTSIHLDDDLTFVWEAVKSLPPKYSEVIHLFYYEGCSSKEIAKILSKNESTVRSLLKRGRDILKEKLKEEYDFEIQ